jgi:hypothetical protein
MKPYSEYRRDRQRSHELAQAGILSERRIVPSELPIDNLSDSELDEYWIRLEAEVLRIENEMMKRGLE